MRRVWMLAVVTLLAAGCASDEAGEDAAAGDSAGMPMDSMAGMDHSQMAGAAAKDGQHEFLRQMSSHHEGLVKIGEAAMMKGSTPQVQQDGHMLHQKQAAERDTMVMHIQHLYQEQYQVQPMPKNVAQADSLAQLSGAEYDRTFYRIVIDHHREGIRMIDQHMQHLTDPAIKQMAEKMKADQQREIADFEKKMGGGA